MSSPSPRSPGRVSDFIHSIRFRLALWFVLVLAVVLVIFGVFVYYRESQAVGQAAEARLSDRLHTVSDFFRATIRGQLDEGQFNTPGLPPGQFELLKTDRLILAGADGKVIRAWGGLSDQQTSQIIQMLTGPSHNGSAAYPVSTSTGKPQTNVPYLFASSPIVVEGHVLGWIIFGQPVDPDMQLERLQLTLVLAGLITLLAALGGSYWLADRALRPIQAITLTAQRIGETDLSRRLNLHTRDELGRLAATFDQMLDRLQAAFARQRQFTADASHELRTPLTIIELETSRALAAGRDPREYQRSMRVIQSENEFMTRLVNELLTLARMDAGQIKLKVEPLDLSDVALDVVERYAPLAAKKGVELLAGDLPEVRLNGDRQYLIQMIGNLVDNAIKYSDGPARQWVRVETGERDEGGKPLAWVRVSDNGAGVRPEDLPHLFDRFYRADQARSHNVEKQNADKQNAYQRNAFQHDTGNQNTGKQNAGEEEGEDDIPGSGLGLSIVQWIARIHQGQVTVQSEPGKGSTFEITLAGAPTA